MGGYACQIPHLAILRFDGIPTDQTQLPVFDEQLRKCFAQSNIVDGIVNAQTAQAVCNILKYQSWTSAQRSALYGYLEDLYE